MNKKSNCCKVCNKALEGKQTQFCSISCKNKTHQSYSAQKERGLTRKKELVQQLGGKCARCGYNQNLAALTFHHLNEKQFKLDSRSLSNRTYGSIEREVKKCQLLCSNCHAEIHNPSLDLV